MKKGGVPTRLSGLDLTLSRRHTASDEIARSESQKKFKETRQGATRPSVPHVTLPALTVKYLVRHATNVTGWQSRSGTRDKANPGKKKSSRGDLHC